ncbi:Neu5Ac-binding protein [Achromobacter insolitus]|uniref:TRAP transporter substrate-binding protein n=1 Tax=Achromobacter insolitus TaxID=217204 RepID=UPI000972C687|nr:TRAP transporter substrate-binding protein [Achromobacter insolitus]APX74999.1 ABC transporter substrate-binding protein [Achromobacter insolitus]OWT58645.1 ABC transporter substrate-binding protein [Achromobacter insolitus]CAB3714963.1 Sialic acid-binding periplasmic protein SiaP [Achromobacter insolitus]VEG67848.1 Neu5Ac-binding protein [Achromobacter insolitus]
MKLLTRRSALRRLCAVPAVALGAGFPLIARAADYTLKYGNNLPVTHPLNIRAQEAAERILKESNGRVDIKIFPNNQLGGDTDMLAQVRSGGIDFFTPSALVIATLVPVAAINAVGFAFKDYNQVWGAMDGALGAHVRAAIAQRRLYAFEKMWDNGFRQTTSSKAPVKSAADMEGLKIRVPVSSLPISMFKGLGAAPASLQFSEVYSSLQTKVVDAQENPLPIIQVAKLYEVQKYCSLTNHIWDGYWFIANGRMWEGLPQDLKTVVARGINEAGLAQREDIKKLNASVQSDLEGKGLQFNQPSANSFREQLRAAGFYKEWQGRFGNEAWTLLEQAVGKLA